MIKTEKIHNELLKIGFLPCYKMLYLDYYIPNTNIRFDINFDKGIFEDMDKRFTNAIYKGDAFEREILHEGDIKDIEHLLSIFKDLNIPI